VRRTENDEAGAFSSPVSSSIVHPSEHKCSHDASQNDNDKAESFSSRVRVASFILSDRYYKHLRQALQNTSRDKCELDNQRRNPRHDRPLHGVQEEIALEPALCGWFYVVLSINYARISTPRYSGVQSSSGIRVPT
jgi:hypothetical protein